MNSVYNVQSYTQKNTHHCKINNNNRSVRNLKTKHMKVLKHKLDIEIKIKIFSN